MSVRCFQFWATSAANCQQSFGFAITCGKLKSTSPTQIDVAFPAVDSFRKGLRAAPAGFFAPLRPRVGNFVIRAWRDEGWRKGLGSLVAATDLLLDGRLDSSGRGR